MGRKLGRLTQRGNAKIFSLCCLALLIAYPFVFLMLPSSNDSEESSELEMAQAVARHEANMRQEEVCRAELNCWSRRHMLHAAAACKRGIEAQAKWQAEWTDGASRPMFSRHAWANEPDGHIVYFGNQVKFQNGFGAWRRVDYACTFDTRSRAVVEVSVGGE